VHQGSVNWHRHAVHAVLAAAAVSLLAGCAASASIPTSSAATGTSTGTAGGKTPTPSPQPTGPTATFTAVTPAPDVTSVPTAPSLTAEEAEADRLAMEQFIANAWDAMDAKRLSDLSIGDCLYFDYDYQVKTTAVFPVDCSSPHEGEVMATYRHPDSAYPGLHNLGGSAEAYFGAAADAMREAGQLPSTTRRHLSPTEADWEAGERTSVDMLIHNSSFGLLERGYLDTDHVTVTEVPDEGTASGDLANTLENGADPAESNVYP
jgi:hypothetical protein